MQLTVRELRQLIRENFNSSPHEELESTIQNWKIAINKLTELISSEDLLTTRSAIETLDGYFYGVKIGTTPTPLQITKTIDGVIKFALQQPPDDQISLLQRHIETAIELPDKLLSLKFSSISNRPASAPVEGKTWGKWLFASAREDVPFEKNTSAENAAFKAISDMLLLNQSIPLKIATQLQHLGYGGEYTNFLVPNLSYQEFYRGLQNISTQTIRNWLGHQPIPSGGEESVDFIHTPIRGGGDCWTGAEEIARAYARAGADGTRKTSSGTWGVTFCATRASNPQSFIFNPEYLYSLGWNTADADIEGSDEVYAVGRIHIDRIIYFPN